MFFFLPIYRWKLNIGLSCPYKRKAQLLPCNVTRLFTAVQFSRKGNRECCKIPPSIFFKITFFSILFSPGSVLISLFPLHSGVWRNTPTIQEISPLVSVVPQRGQWTISHERVHILAARERSVPQCAAVDRASSGRAERLSKLRFTSVPDEHRPIWQPCAACLSLEQIRHHQSSRQHPSAHGRGRKRSWLGGLRPEPCDRLKGFLRNLQTLSAWLDEARQAEVL